MCLQKVRHLRQQSINISGLKLDLLRTFPVEARTKVLYEKVGNASPV